MTEGQQAEKNSACTTVKREKGNYRLQSRSKKRVSPINQIKTCLKKSDPLLRKWPLDKWTNVGPEIDPTLPLNNNNGKTPSVHARGKQKTPLETSFLIY